jgi:outer membrane lipoprotein-sorting protein
MPARLQRADGSWTEQVEVVDRPDGTQAVVDEHGEEVGQIVSAETENPERGWLVLDAERGSLLRMSARLDGQEFNRHEVVEVAFDEELADETFRLRPPAGEPPQGE